MEFAYEATDADGELIEGTIAAESAAEATARIRRRGLVPLELIPGDLTTGDLISGDLIPGKNDLPAEPERPAPTRAPALRSVSPNSYPKPPPAPREPVFGTLYPLKNPLANFGMWWIGFCLVFSIAPLTSGSAFGTLLVGGFAAIGWFTARKGFKAARSRLRVWSEGTAAPAVITWTGKNKSYSVNDRSPFVIRYEFEADGITHSGERESFNDELTRYEPGDECWIVYLPGDPSISAEWPPIA